MSFVLMYPGAFQIPKATSTTLSFQVFPGQSVNVQLKVASSWLLPIKGGLGRETILGRSCWCDVEMDRVRMTKNIVDCFVENKKWKKLPIDIIFQAPNTVDVS